jgi:hypothetical protein
VVPARPVPIVVTIGIVRITTLVGVSVTAIGIVAAASTTRTRTKIPQRRIKAVDTEDGPNAYCRENNETKSQARSDAGVFRDAPTFSTGIVRCRPRNPPNTSRIHVHEKI